MHNYNNSEATALQQNHNHISAAENENSDEENTYSNTNSKKIGVRRTAPAVPGTHSNDTGYVEMPVTSAVNYEGANISNYNEDKMRRRLQFFFMNPIEKWHAKRKFPYKFVVQIVKIILVTMQLCLFAHSRYNHINYTWDNRVAFSHLFLRGWDSGREVESYPPAVGPFALYKKDEFFDTIDYAIAGYANISQSIGSYDYSTNDNTMGPLKLCLYNYKEGQVFGFNESYVFDSAIEKLCEWLPSSVVNETVQAFLESRGIYINFAALVKAYLMFDIKTVNFKPYGGPLSVPDCYQFDIEIYFNNQDHDGQMLLSLDANAKRLTCNENGANNLSTQDYDWILTSSLNISVLIVCMLSFGLCTRALYRAYLLRCVTIEFFRSHFQKELSFEGRMEFVNFWYIMILFNDVLLILGSAMKEQIEHKLLVDQWNTCSLFLGIGNLLVWFGVLRYLGFFKTYNVVILVLKKAAPKILRFLIAALLIYAGFAFCGWLILGPYHMKFRSLATTSECLFSLINGDDMFATFATLSIKASWLWWFCQIYLYSFISLYIYIVLSLFIAVIMDAYDTIKSYYRDGFPLSDLKQFVGTLTDQEIRSGIFMNDHDSFDNGSFWQVMRKVCCCGCSKCSRTPRNAGTSSGYTSLSSILK